MDSSDDTRSMHSGGEPPFGEFDHPLPDHALPDRPAAKPFPLPEIAGYRMIRKRGEGGQGTVFEAEELATHRRVCIKVLRDRDLANDADRARFDLEIRTLAGMQQESVVPIFSAGMTNGGAPYYVMPLIEGVPITTFVHGSNMAPREILELFVIVCRAIGHVHRSAHMIHRDLKPSNILVDLSGKPTVLDFGLARPVGVRVGSLTMSREVLGTASYMSPEQTRDSSATLTPASDVYALGVILFELLTTQLPYRVDLNNWVATTLVIQHEEPPPPSRVVPHEHLSGSMRGRRIETDVDTIVLRALSKLPQHRYADAAEMADDIERYLRGEPIVAKRHSKVYVAYRRLRRFASANVLATQLMCILFVTAFVQYPVLNAVAWVERLDALFMTAAAPLGIWAAAPTQMKHVSIVTIGDAEKMRVAAELAGVPWPQDATSQPVIPTPKDNPRRRAERLIYARMLDQLATLETPPRVVLFNLYFRNDSASDSEFAAAVARLRERNCRVVVARETHGEPDLNNLPSKVIYDSTIAGIVNAQPKAPTGWELTLMVIREDTAPIPTGPLLAYALARHPSSEPRFASQGDGTVLQVDYFRGSARDEMAPSELLECSGVAQIGRDPGDLKVGDFLQFMMLAPPSVEVTNAATLPIEDFFVASDADLQAFASDRVLVVGFDRSPSDRVLDCFGRPRPLVLMPALALEQLLGKRFLSIIHRWWALGVVILACTLGSFLGRAYATRIVRLIATTAGVAVLITCASVLAVPVTLVACNPIAPIVGLVFGAALAAGIQRVHVADQRV